MRVSLKYVVNAVIIKTILIVALMDNFDITIEIVDTGWILIGENVAKKQTDRGNAAQQELQAIIFLHVVRYAADNKKPAQENGLFIHQCLMKLHMGDFLRIQRFMNSRFQFVDFKLRHVTVRAHFTHVIFVGAAG